MNDHTDALDKALEYLKNVEHGKFEIGMRRLLKLLPPKLKGEEPIYRAKRWATTHGLKAQRFGDIFVFTKEAK